MSMEVRRIDKKLAEKVVSEKHYSRRLGIFWEGFGLYLEGLLLGVVCYGQPSAPIQKHAFTNRDFRLYELTRLVVDSNVANGASMLIGRSLQMLSVRPAAVISYADSAHGHAGIVYQATNWIYTGPVVSHDKLYLLDGVPTHPMTLRDRLGVTEPSKWARDNGIASVKPSPKHRYFQFVGDRRQVRSMRARLAYPPVSEYPKSEKTTYDAGAPCFVVAAIDAPDSKR